MPRSPFADGLSLDLDAPTESARRRHAARAAARRGSGFGGSDKPELGLEDIPPEKSGWESLLTYIGRPGYAVRDVLTGNFEGAGRQLADLVGDTADAFLPGDLIGEASRTQDYTEGSDLLREYGIADLQPGMGKLAADIGVGLLTDPLTYLGLGAIGTGAKAGTKAITAGIPFLKASRVAIPGSEYLVEAGGKAVSGLKAGLGALPGGKSLMQAGNEAGHALRSTFAALRPTEKIGGDVAAAEALGGSTRQAAQTYPVEAFRKVDPITQRRAVETVRGVTSEAAGPGYTNLGIESAKEMVTHPEQLALFEQRVAGMPWDDATKASVLEQAGKISDYTRGAYGQELFDQVLAVPEGLTSNIKTHLPDLTPVDYFPGRYDLPDVPGTEFLKAGQPSLIKSAKIQNAADLAEYLTTTGGKLDTDLPKILGEYGENLGRATQAAELGRRTLGDFGTKAAKVAGGVEETGFKALSDPGSRARMTEAIDALRASGDLDSARTLETAFKGLPPRGKLMTALSGLNKKFKQAATAGVIVPRINFTVRNILANVAQVAGNPETRAVTGQAAMRAPRDILRAIGDGLRDLGINVMPESELAQVGQAARASGGSREAFLKGITNPRIRSAVEHGVLDAGFIDSEALAAKLGRDPGMKNILDWTSTITQSAEQQMRYGLFDDLLKAKPHLSPAQAAKEVSDTLFNYKYASEANRTFRDIVPFGQFTAKAVPQTLKLLKEQPAVASAIRPLYQQDSPENPIYPYLSDQPVVPLGDSNYLTSFGLPFEVLGNIPNLSDDLRISGEQARRGIIGQMSPMLKTGYSWWSGKDPAFDSPWLGYDKNPALARALGAGENSEAARYYNALAGTGLIQPIASTVGALGQVTNPDITPGARALSGLTGARVEHVDEDRATQQLLEQFARHDPSVRQRVSYYKKDDPKIQALNRTIGRLGREKKKREKAQGK